MVSPEVLSTGDLNKYSELGLDVNLIGVWIKCAEFLINKHSYNRIIIRHKKLSDGSTEELQVDVRTGELDTSKLPNSIQERPIIEMAGIAMGLLVTQLLRPCKSIRVLKSGDGYDYIYMPKDTEIEELIEMTGTESPGAGQDRLNRKLSKFIKYHPTTKGYISVSCFYDKVQLHWGHKT
jgi:hypothetical protein